MLKITKERPDSEYQSSSRPMLEIFPWMGPVSDRVVLCKDGSLVACFEFFGMDSEGAEQFELDTLSARMDRVVRSLGPEFTLWFTLDRRKALDYVSDEQIENPVAQQIDELWRTDFEKKRHYRDRTYLSIVYTPKSGTGRFLDNVGRLMTNGLKPVPALFGALRLSFGGEDRFLFTVDEIVSGVKVLESVSEQFWSGLPGIRSERLKTTRLNGFLNRLCSPGNNQEEVRLDPNQTFLDTSLGVSSLQVNQNHLRFDGDTSKYGAVGSVKMWPDSTVTGICDTLMSADAELVFSIAFQCLDQGSAKKYVEDLRRHHANFSKGLVTRIKEMMTHQESENIDNATIIKFAEADNALTDLGSGGSAGFLLTTLVVYGDSQKDLDRGYSDCSKRLQEQGFLMMRETMHQLSGWSGILPGQKKRPVRWVFASGANLSDMAPVHAVRYGSRVSRYLSQQRQKPTSALTVLETDSKTPFFFDFFATDLPHGFVIGPSRMGKSIFVMFLVSQFQRYNPQVFIFDKDRTCRIPTIAHGGKYLDLGKEHVPINPLCHLSDKADIDWFSNWLEILLTSRDYKMSAGDDVAISKAVGEVLVLKESMPVSLGDLSNLLPMHLSAQLSRWVGSGPLAGYFDNKEDALDLSDWTAMSMDDLFNNDTVAQAFLDYAFRRIYKRLDGRPTIIYIEEAWFALKDERFAAKVNDWLRTLAKKNALLLMATQSLEELSMSSSFVAMVDNIPNRIFLPNPSAHASADLYRSRFGLNGAQVEAIRTATPKLNYYICTPTMTRMIEAKFSPAILAWLRSDSNAQKVFDESIAQYKTKWMEVYYERMCKQD